MSECSVGIIVTDIIHFSLWASGLLVYVKKL